MSVAFLLLHLSIAKSSVGLVQYSAMAGLRDEFANMPGTRVSSSSYARVNSILYVFSVMKSV